MYIVMTFFNALIVFVQSDHVVDVPSRLSSSVKTEALLASKGSIASIATCTEVELAATLGNAAAAKTRAFFTAALTNPS